MDSINQTIWYWLDQLGNGSWLFAKILSALSGDHFFKGGIILALFWGLWFARDQDEIVDRQRETILATFMGALLSLVIARFLASIVPFHLRPFASPGFCIRIPHDVSRALKEWNAFPSDHAALFSSLTAGIWLICRPLGYLVITYVVFVILFPRIYLGLHYPIDIIGGVIVGIMSFSLINIPNIKKSITKPFLQYLKNYPSVFYGIFFLFTFLLATLFDSLRHIGTGVIKVLHRYYGG